jgi:formylglycine-generating enzyme required for sulfatase activity
MVTVQGGTLPQGSELAGQTVGTFQIGRTEVTWDEWQTVRTWAVANGYTDLAGVGQGSADNHPVRNVSWYDVVKWSNAKSQMDGLDPVYYYNNQIFKIGNLEWYSNLITSLETANGYRLANEMEWEWAAHGGIYSNGYSYSGSNNKNDVSWNPDNSNGSPVGLLQGSGTWPVAQKKPNELNIYDMSGNVWEWTSTIQKHDSSDGYYRLLRGGGWSWVYGMGNISMRYLGKTSDFANAIGFRLARNIGPKISISGTMPEPTLNQAYAGYTFTAVGATSAPVWSVSSGSLPPGMSFNATTATLSGTPTTAGNYTFTIKVASGGYSDEVEVVMVIAPPQVNYAEMVLVQGGALPGNSQINQTVPNFQIGKYEVTWVEWSIVRNWAVANGYNFTYEGSRGGDNFPVHTITWYDAVKWCNAKSEMEGLEPVYSVNDVVFKSGSEAPILKTYANGYRLPSEAEWEWAARGGVNSQGYTFSGSNILTEVAWCNSNTGNDGYPGAKIAGIKKSNELGIFDMSGNVLEYCWDLNSGSRSFRGGSWVHGAYECNVSYRYWIPPNHAGIYNNQGFRIARNEEKMVAVQGGTLPSGSGLAGQVVQSFEIGRYEVTWVEWQNVCTYAIANGYDLTGIGNGTASTHPVQRVSWYDAVKWCNAKSEKEGRTAVYLVSGALYRSGEYGSEGSGVVTQKSGANGYRLPSEAEWEWAARGGVSSKGYTYSGSHDVNAVAWTWENNTPYGTKAVGTKAANELGIYDMSGNVWEWCEDVAYTYDRRVRGSGWSGSANFAEVSFRNSFNPVNRNSSFGFRLARNIGPKISLSGTMPEATLNQAYTGYTFTASGATGTPVWSVSSGSLPPGMSFNATTATLSGTPTIAGNYTFTINVASGGYSDEVEVILKVKNHRIIPPNENGWSYDDSVGNWKLVYTDKLIIFYEQTDQSIGTQSTLFVGTEQECQDHINLLNLKRPEELAPDEEVEVEL